MKGPYTVGSRTNASKTTAIQPMVRNSRQGLVALWKYSRASLAHGPALMPR